MEKVKELFRSVSNSKISGPYRRYCSRDEFDDESSAFIESRDFFFLSTIDENNRPTVSYKGGDIGLVKILDKKTAIFPSYNGNGMFLSMGNI